jgi:hypothetical protein
MKLHISDHTNDICCAVLKICQRDRKSIDRFSGMNSLHDVIYILLASRHLNIVTGFDAANRR